MMRFLKDENAYPKFELSSSLAPQGMRSVKVEIVFELDVHRNGVPVFRGGVKFDLPGCADCTLRQTKGQTRDRADAGHLTAGRKYRA